MIFADPVCSQEAENWTKKKQNPIFKPLVFFIHFNLFYSSDCLLIPTILLDPLLLLQEFCTTGCVLSDAFIYALLHFEHLDFLNIALCFA